MEHHDGIRATVTVLAWGALLAGCSGDEEASSAGSSDLVVPLPGVAKSGAALDSGDLAVGIVTRGDGTRCTGVLVEPRVVLTAGSCLRSTTYTFTTMRAAF